MPEMLTRGAARAELLRPIALPTHRALHVAVSGGIGTGKSTVSRVLKRLGAVVVDNDELARAAIAPGSPGAERVREAFGPGVFAGDQLDRRRLAQLVFANVARRHTLEDIIVPWVLAETKGRLDALPAGAVGVADIPLLVETGTAEEYDAVVMVTAPLHLRLKRLEERGLPREEAQARIRAQVSDAQRREVTHIWVNNAGSTPELEELVADLAHTWLGMSV